MNDAVENRPALPPELEALREQMAAHVHEVWADGRRAQGWTWGPRRDDEKKEHPCLVPYDRLPEEEKEYDRRTAEETLRFILGQGYRLLPPDSQPR